MDSIEELNGVQVTSCIVHHDFEKVCPEYAIEEGRPQKQKKSKTEKESPEYCFYRPFQNDVSIANKYLSASPRALEILELVASDSLPLRRRGVAFLAFLLQKCDNTHCRSYIVDHVLTRISKHMVESLSMSEDSLHYVFTIIIECMKTATVDQVRHFVSSFGFYKALAKHKALRKGDSGYSASRFYQDVVNNGLLDDTGLEAYINADERDSCPESGSDLFRSNSKKGLCIILLVGLRGFNILEKPKLVRLILEHIRHDSVVDSICTVKMLIVIIMQVLSTQCSRLSITLGNSQWSDIPEPIVSSTAVTLSHLISQMTEETSLEKKRIVDLSRHLRSMCAEFIAHVEGLCDVATMSIIMSKFDITIPSVADIILKVICSKGKLGPLYMSRLRCNYNGTMEYMVIVKFLCRWFDYAASLRIASMECISYIPPCLCNSFFNYGLLSNDRWVRQGTMRMLYAFLCFFNDARGLIPAGDGRDKISDAITDYVSALIPDFKTLINVKFFSEENNTEDTQLSLNIRKETKCMVLVDTGAVVTSENGNILLGIKDSDLLVTDWLKCLYIYSRFIGIADGKSLYDPLKLLKEDKIISNLSLQHQELSMALVDCIFHLGVGQIYSGIAFTKVQKGSLRYILTKYVELRSVTRPESVDPDRWESSLLHCRNYLNQVLGNCGYFASTSEQWIHYMRTEEDSDIFTFLFEHCMDNPLEVMLGSLREGQANRTYQTFRCIDCSMLGEFEGPLILRLALTFLSHLSNDNAAGFECESCAVRYPNICSLFKKERGYDISNCVQYILRVCNSLQSGEFGIHIGPVLGNVPKIYEINTHSGRSAEKVDALDVTTDMAIDNTDIVIDDTYLHGCSVIVEAVCKFDQDINSLKELARIIIDTLSLRIARSEREDAILNGKWKGERFTKSIGKCMALDTEALYTHLFCSVVRLLDSSPELSLKGDPFNGLTFDDNMMWMQHSYLSHMIGAKEIEEEELANRFIISLTALLADEDVNNNQRGMRAVTLSKICRLIPGLHICNSLEEYVERLLQYIEIPVSCAGCTDALNCNYGFASCIMDIASCLVESSDNPQFAAKMLQSKLLMELVENICKMNSDKYHIGDVMESHLFLSFLKLIRCFFKPLTGGKVNIDGINWTCIAKLLGPLSTCYRCSYSESDLVLKQIIMGIVNASSRALGDAKSAMLRLPQFRDFACVSKAADTGRNQKCKCKRNDACNHETRSHGETRNWLTMSDGFAMVSEDANWLCLNNKRVAMTTLDFPPNRKTSGTDLRNTFRHLQILYPPSTTKSPKKSDEIFGCIILLNKVLKTRNKYLQHLLVSDPYHYDVEYLIPFLTGRLCMMLYSQLYAYHQEFEEIFQKCGFVTPAMDEQVPISFVKTLDQADAHEAAKRIYNQTALMKFDYCVDDSFSAHAMEQVVRNGVLEICILGLLSRSVRKDSMKALGLVLKLLQNMIDAAMIRSTVSGRQGKYKMHAVGFSGAYNVHSVILWLQRCHLYGSQIDKSLQILFAASIIHRAINPGDPLYTHCNKYMISRFEPRLQEVPLFFECFCAHDASDRPNFLGFAMQLLLSASEVLEDYSVIFNRRILQQLMSFALLEGTPLHNKVQAAACVMRCASADSATVNELLHMGTLTWISNMASIISRGGFTDASEMVVATLLMCTMTRLLKYMTTPLCDRYHSIMETADEVDAEMRSDHTRATTELPKLGQAEPEDFMYILRDIASTAEALEQVATGWYHVLKYVHNDLLTPLRLEGYRMYLLCNEEILAAIINTVKHKESYSFTVSSLLATSIKRAESAVTRTTSLIISAAT